MKVANIAEFKNHLSQYLAGVANGEEVEIRKRNAPLARVVPIRCRFAPPAATARSSVAVPVPSSSGRT